MPGTPDEIAAAQANVQAKDDAYTRLLADATHEEGAPARPGAPAPGIADLANPGLAEAWEALQQAKDELHQLDPEGEMGG